MKYIYHAVERWSLSFNMPNNLFQQTFSFLSDSLRDDVSTPPLPPLRRAPVQNPPPLAPSVPAPPVRAPAVPASSVPASSVPASSAPVPSVPASSPPAPSAPAAAAPAVSSSDLSFVPGRRTGCQNAVLDGHRYFLDRKRADKEYWKCTLYKVGCTARITTEQRQLQSSPPTHTHEVQHSEIKCHVVKQNLKRKAVISDAPTRDVVADSTKLLRDEEFAKMGCKPSSLNRMARKARYKSRDYPSNPTSLEDLVIPPHYLQTSIDEPLLLWDSGYSSSRRRSLLLGTPTNVAALHDAEHLVIDGTFKSAPPLFTQMLGIHGLFEDNWHLPLIFGLLPGKSQVLYEDLLEQLDSFGPFDPQSILCDYETGLRNACASTWPSCTVRGCYFHFTKATFKHLCDMGLKTEYEVEDSDVRKYYKLISALPFVPEDDVLDAWLQLRPLLPVDLTAFASYVEYTWVGSRSSSPLFSIPSWNQHDASLMKLPRSTNMAEGWHHGFNSMLSCTHPSMWKFLDALKKEHNLIRMKLVRMRQLEEPERRAAKWIKYDDKIQRLCDSYNRHTSVLEYLKKCANVC